MRPVRLRQICEAIDVTRLGRADPDRGELTCTKTRNRQHAGVANGVPGVHWDRQIPPRTTKPVPKSSICAVKLSTVRCTLLNPGVWA